MKLMNQSQKPAIRKDLLVPIVCFVALCTVVIISNNPPSFPKHLFTATNIPMHGVFVSLVEEEICCTLKRTGNNFEATSIDSSSLAKELFDGFSGSLNADGINGQATTTYSSGQIAHHTIKTERDKFFVQLANAADPTKWSEYVRRSSCDISSSPPKIRRPSPDELARVQVTPEMNAGFVGSWKFLGSSTTEPHVGSVDISNCGTNAYCMKFHGRVINLYFRDSKAHFVNVNEILINAVVKGRSEPAVFYFTLSADKPNFMKVFNADKTIVHLTAEKQVVKMEV